MQKSKYILDIGCGDGFRTHVLGRIKSHKVFGIDISSDSIKTAKSRYKDAIFTQMSTENLTFKNNRFDEIYATDVLEHVDNITKTIQEISRVLKIGGKLHVIVPHEKSENFLLKIRPTFQKEIHHVRVFKDNKLENMLSKYNCILQMKKTQDFIIHLELIFRFRDKTMSIHQLDIGKWNKNYFTILLHILVAYTNTYWVFNTNLKYIPIWIVTIPLGYIINSVGNKFLPKSIYYQFVKIK